MAVGAVSVEAGRAVTAIAETLTAESLATLTQRIRHVLDHRFFRVVYQPIMQLSDGRMVAAEALSRFATEPARPPAAWFADAWRVGLGAEFELAALDAALAAPGGTLDGCRIAVNLSPLTITHADLPSRLAAAGPSRVVIELTEHMAVHDYDAVRLAVANLREHGVCLAVDDMGTGFASLCHIVKLAPDIIKLDRELVHDLDADPVRQSLVTAMVTFAAEVGSDIVAEGIETGSELEAVRALGIRYGQGVFLRPPVPPRTLPAARRAGASPWNPGRATRPATYGELETRRTEIASVDRAPSAMACVAERRVAGRPIKTINR
jgi:EAL domain-containing protein (putative c-di-GMP-specific phosphodiesterase class I)